VFDDNNKSCIAETDQRGLTIRDFTRIGRNGIGDPQNAYIHAMGYYEGRLYAGTTRHSMALLKLFPPIDPPALDPWPVSVPPKVQDLDMRGQIWRWSSSTESWELAHRSPLIIGKKGEEVPRDLGYRGMTVFQGRSDPKPALYAASMSTVLRGTAAHILRSYDGLNFEAVSEPGIGNPEISTFRELVSFDGHLYAPPAGEGVNFNSNRRSIVMRSPDPGVGKWEVACESGFGDKSNNGIFMMTKFNDHLYAGTFNNYQGYQVWKTKANGGGPCDWKKVIERGAFRGPLSQIAMALCPFNGALYVGSSIQNGGYDRYNLVGPASGEVIRIFPDDSWELLVGTPRDTPAGREVPLSGLGPGFDNIFAGYTWRMVVHDGWLYVTTFDWSVFLKYAHRASPTARRLIKMMGVDKLIEVGGGFDLWRTRDGVNWVPVSLNGMGNPFNYGGRTMVSSPDGLFIGTANPFAPEVAIVNGASRTYIANPDGGAEVWLGRKKDRHCDVRTARTSAPIVVADRGGGAMSSEAAPIEGSDAGSATAVDVAITGGAGLIGRHVVQRLLSAGYSVRVLDLPGTTDVLPDDARLSIVEGRIEDLDAVAETVRGATYVCHLAARLAGSCPKEVMRRVNVDGAHNLLRTCMRVGKPRRFVFASSVSVYEGQFTPTEWPIAEASPLRTDGGSALADYGMSKIAGENLTRFFSRKYGFEHTILRYALVYGVGDPVIDPLALNINTMPGFGEGPPGEMPRQYLHVYDAAEAMLCALFSEKAKDETFTIASSEATSFRDMARTIRRLHGEPTADDRIPDPTRAWRRYVQPYDIGKARRELEFTPAISMEEGLAEIIDNHRHRQLEGERPPFDATMIEHAAIG
jgi:nucleoside-diphosphate-sugar epimerase